MKLIACVVLGLLVAIALATGSAARPASLGATQLAGTEGADSAQSKKKARSKRKRRRLRLRLRRRNDLYRVEGFRVGGRRHRIRKGGRLGRLRVRRQRPEKTERRQRKQYPLAPRRNPPLTATAAGAFAASHDAFTLFRGPATVITGVPNRAEPAAANIGRVQLVVANWPGVALSTDNGLTWLDSISATKAVKDRDDQSVPGQGFCCDQVVHTAGRGSGKDPLLAWAIQTYAGDEHEEHNAIVMHIFPGERSLSKGKEAKSCRYVFTASLFGLNKKWVDRPRLGSSEENLFLTVGYGKVKKDSLQGEIILRMDLDDLFECRGTSDPASQFDAFVDKKLAGYYVPVDNAAENMYLARHGDGGLFNGDIIKIQKWPDNASEPTKFDKNVDNWASKAGGCQLSFGGDPCAIIPTFPDTGFRVSNSVGWLWTAGAGGDFPFPHVRVAVFDTGSLDVVREAEISSNSFAVTYPSVAVNGAGVIGLTLYEMGGSVPPRMRAFIVTQPRDGWPPPHGNLLFTSGNPLQSEWGDYFSVSRYNGCAGTFLATASNLLNASELAAQTAWFGEAGKGCPDLQALSAVLDGRVQEGERITLNAGVKNTGSAEVGRADVAWYLSKDNDPDDKKDLRIGPTVALTSIPAGEDLSTGNQTVTVPAGEKAGEHDRLLACVDWNEQVDEISELDNCAVRKYTTPVRQDVPPESFRP